MGLFAKDFGGPFTLTHVRAYAYVHPTYPGGILFVFIVHRPECIEMAAAVVTRTVSGFTGLLGAGFLLHHSFLYDLGHWTDDDVNRTSQIQLQQNRHCLHGLGFHGGKIKSQPEGMKNSRRFGASLNIT